uniref:Uncharacterized protein n=1 Tax=Arundo donax TaxID=35708 RepID=A0A0A9H606_ARUDO
MSLELGRRCPAAEKSRRGEAPSRSGSLELGRWCPAAEKSRRGEALRGRSSPGRDRSCDSSSLGGAAKEVEAEESTAELDSGGKDKVEEVEHGGEDGERLGRWRRSTL